MSMEDVKEDEKVDKSINFHQMELDDRILKVWREFQRKSTLTIKPHYHFVVLF